MVGGNWTNSDGLYLQFGTSKAVPTTMGDYQMPGEMREIEFTITMAGLTTSPAIQGNTTFLPTGVFIEQVEFDTDVAAVGGTSFSVGTMRADRSTVISNTAFINGALLATHDAGGEKSILTTGSTGAGATIGTTTSFTDGFAYITALAAGTYSAGSVKVRIKYRGIGTITQ